MKERGPDNCLWGDSCGDGCQCDGCEYYLSILDGEGDIARLQYLEDLQMRREAYREQIDEQDS